MSRNLVFFIPGLFGSKLMGPDGQLWPPTALEYLHARFVDQAAMAAKIRVQDDVQATEVLRTVSGNEAYESFLKRLEVLIQENKDYDIELVPLAYDWRRPVSENASLLAEEIAEHVKRRQAKGQQVVLIAHSMGGLIARYILETSIRRQHDWIQKVRGLITVATPHRGSIFGIMAVRGMLNRYGLKGATIRKLVEARIIPSLIDLMPPPDQPTVVRQEGGQATELLTTELFLERYDEIVHDQYRGNQHIHGVLSTQLPSGLPPYVCVASGTHKTPVRLHEMSGVIHPIEYLRAGDDTVTVDSALLPNALSIFTKGNHLGVCNNLSIENAMLHMFSLPPIWQAFSDEQFDAQVSISPSDPHEGQQIEVYAELDEGLRLEDATLEIIDLNSDEEKVIWSSPILAHEYWLKELQILKAGRFSVKIINHKRVICQQEFFIYGIEKEDIF